MFSAIFFSICALLIVAAIFYMILHRHKVNVHEKPDNPVSEQDFDKSA